MIKITGIKTRELFKSIPDYKTISEDDFKIIMIHLLKKSTIMKPTNIYDRLLIDGEVNYVSREPTSITYKKKTFDIRNSKSSKQDKLLKQYPTRVVYLMQFDLNDVITYKVGYTSKTAIERLSQILVSFMVHKGTSPKAKVVDTIQHPNLKLLENTLHKDIAKKFKPSKVASENTIDGSSEFFTGSNVKAWFLNHKVLLEDDGIIEW